MEIEILSLIRWLEKTGVLPAGTAAALVVFCALVLWFGKTQSRDFNNAIRTMNQAHEESISAIKSSHDETLKAVKEQVEIEKRSNMAFERRYDQLRADTSMLQTQVSEMNKQVWVEVLGYLRSTKT